MGEFYITLHSNACESIFPSNKTSDFRNKLSDVIQLSSGEWEVCLFDMSYVYGHVLIATDEHICSITYGDEKMHHFERLYSFRNVRSLDDLIEELRDRLNPAKISVKNRKFSMTLNCKKYFSIYFSDQVTAMLGLTESAIVLNKTHHDNFFKDKSDEEWYLMARHTRHMPSYTERFFKSNTGGDMVELWGDITCFELAGCTKLLLYTNIIEAQYVADVKAKCLKVIPHIGQYGEICYHSFQQSQYVNLCVSSLELIHIDILSETGQPIRFDFSPVSITLKFRQKRLR